MRFAILAVVSLTATGCSSGSDSRESNGVRHERSAPEPAEPIGNWAAPFETPDQSYAESMCWEEEGQLRCVGYSFVAATADEARRRARAAAREGLIREIGDNASGRRFARGVRPTYEASRASALASVTDIDTDTNPDAVVAAQNRIDDRRLEIAAALDRWIAPAQIVDGRERLAEVAGGYRAAVEIGIEASSADALADRASQAGAEFPMNRWVTR